MSLPKNVIVRTVRKRNRDQGGHGGSWKVAYADFVTAMMAFFLLMWLVTMVAPEKRARVATYFKHFSLFEKSGVSFMEKNSSILKESGGEISIPKEINQAGKKEMTREELKEKLRMDTEKRLADVKDQVIVEVFEGGVRIQLVDNAGKQIFPLGSAEPSPIAKEIFRVITENIKDVPNRIVIEGHTDALSYSSSRYTNWELSTERASAARKELEANGLDPDRLARVSGFAATQPLIKENPNDPRNRRISIILQYAAGNR